MPARRPGAGQRRQRLRPSDLRGAARAGWWIDEHRAGSGLAEALGPGSPDGARDPRLRRAARRPALERHGRKSAGASPETRRPPAPPAAAEIGRANGAVLDAASAARSCAASRSRPPTSVALASRHGLGSVGWHSWSRVPRPPTSRPGRPGANCCVSARSTAGKGHDVLVAALAADRGSPWRLTCVGGLDLEPVRRRPRPAA